VADEKDTKVEDEDVKAEATPEPKAKDEDPKAKDEPKAEDKPKAEPKPKRRGAAETTTKKEPVKTAPTNADGIVEVRASARFVRRAPRKARLVMDHIRGKRVDEARALLHHTPRAAAVDIAKLLDSAVANAENNFELDPGDLRIHRATVDEGPTIKRFRPRALGRATPIHKRTSHMTITLTTTADVAGSADTAKARK
jgi:large subunit ribosomal protein L22